MVLPTSPADAGREPRPPVGVRSTTGLIAIVGRHRILTAVCGGLTIALAGGFAGVVWWIFRPPLPQILAYAALLAFIFLIAGVLLILLLDRKPRGRVALVASGALAFLLCGLIPGGSFYTFAVSHEPPGELHSDIALLKWEYAEYGYFGDEPDPAAAARYVCSVPDHEAIMKGMGEFTPENVRRGVEARSFRDVTIRYSWSFPTDSKKWVEPTGNEATIPQVLEITMSWWVTPSPEEGRTDPYAAQSRSLQRVEFGMRRNALSRWCVHSAKYLGPDDE